MKLIKRWCYWSEYDLNERNRYVWVEIDLQKTKHKFLLEKDSVLNWYIIIDTNDYSIVYDTLREYIIDSGDTINLNKNNITRKEKENVFKFAKECANNFVENIKLMRRNSNA